MKVICSLKTVVIILSLIMFACGPTREVRRVSTDEVIDLSGRWNDTDSRLTAEEMISDVLNRIWLTDFMTANGKKPVVVVGTIRNKSSEHIPTDAFIKDIERELLNSGKVQFVADKEQREDVRDEREDQQKFSSEESMKKFYKELGADFILLGVITSTEDAYEGERTILYQVDLELVNIETNAKVWLGNKKIKKYIGQSSYKP
jgi:hypothetical protein